MNGSDFRAWREARKISQTKAAELAGVNRRTVIRAEGQPQAQLHDKLADLMGREGEVIAEKAPKSAAAPIPKGLREAMLRNPPYAKTAAEAKAMRTLRADQRGVPLSKIRLLPLRPDWRRLEGGRVVNGAIPHPVDGQAPAWAGWRGVPTSSGAVYDYETAHRMTPPERRGGAMVTAGEW